jgi:HAD superfamily hydrolase (TIGR01544 family)
MRMIKQGKDSI